MHDCSVLYRSVGCYAESSEERALPDLMITDSNFCSSSYSGKRIDWSNYGVYLDE